MSFEIEGVLLGEPQTVVDTTDQVAGHVAVELADLAVSRFSETVINARTFTTNSDQRNRAIRGPVILDSGSDEHEFITFTPTSIEGLHGLEAAAGESYELTVNRRPHRHWHHQRGHLRRDGEMVDEATLQGRRQPLS